MAATQETAEPSYKDHPYAAAEAAVRQQEEHPALQSERPNGDSEEAQQPLHRAVSQHYDQEVHAAAGLGDHAAQAPVQGHFGHHQQLLYAQQDPHGQHMSHLHQQAHHEPSSQAPDGHEEQPSPHELQHQQPQAAHIQHNLHMQPHSGGLVLPHPASFAQQLMDPHMSQQQIAQYHQQIAHFQPQAYQQQLTAQYHPGHLPEVSHLYFGQGVPAPHHQQSYQDASGNLQDPGKAPDMSIDEAAAAHLTALRNTGRPDSQLGESAQQVAMGQPPLGHLAIHPGMPESAGPNVHRDAYGQTHAHPLLAATARVPSKRKAWRASHEGQGAEPVEQAADGSRARRKQTRRPDRLCHHEGCFVTPTYNYPNEKKRIFCVTHKLDGMVNVVAKRCAHPDCTVNPRFNFEGITRGMYCSEHKLEGMVNVIDRRCQEPECKKFPSHNYPGSHKKLFCATHKKEGMVDMSHGSS